jgi:peptide/nickel transport system ATP-binding protein
LGLIESPLYISAGTISLQGRSIIEAPENIRGSQISMIFQDPLVSLNPLKTIGEQLIKTIKTHFNISKAEALDRSKKLLSDVGIDPERIEAYPHTFSGGMRQRVVIALALAPEPSVIIADEPTTALDVSVQAQILNLLKQLCTERGTSIILITHDMGVISETTDRVAVLYSGRLVEIGKTSDVLQRPQHPYTAGLVASTPNIDPSSFDKKLFQIPGAMPDIDDVPDGCAFHPRCEHARDKCQKHRPPLFDARVSCWLSEKPGGTL